jgi:hypothetical protein
MPFTNAIVLPDALFKAVREGSLFFFLMTLLLILTDVIFPLIVVGCFVVFLVQALASWAFGWTSFVFGLLVEMAVEPVPFGSYRLIHIDWSREEMPGLAHSQTYVNECALAHLREWVGVTLRRSAGHGDLQ